MVYGSGRVFGSGQPWTEHCLDFNFSLIDLYELPIWSSFSCNIFMHTWSSTCLTLNHRVAKHLQDPISIRNLVCLMLMLLKCSVSDRDRWTRSKDSITSNFTPLGSIGIYKQPLSNSKIKHTAHGQITNGQIASDKMPGTNRHGQRG